MAFEGVCHGGPLDGQQATSRCPEGFLLVDKPRGWCWVYELVGDQGGFFVRDEAGEPVQVEGPKNRYRAACEGKYDVLAAPWAGGDPDEVDAYEGG